MIELKDICTCNLDLYPYDKELLHLLYKNGIDDLQKLKNEISNGNEEINDKIILEELQRVIKEVKSANKRGYEPKIFYANNYENKGLNDYEKSRLESNDYGIISDALLFGNPFLEYSSKMNSLKKFNIGALKYYLSHCAINYTNKPGENALLVYSDKIGDKSIEPLIKAINFYEEQAIRQLKTSYDDDFFYNDYDEKARIITFQIREIINYFNDTTQEFVWGKYPDSQKLAFLKAVTNKCEKSDKLIDKMIDIISTYTTLDEVKSDIVKTRTINRFIKR